MTMKSEYDFKNTERAETRSVPINDLPKRDIELIEAAE